MDDERELPRHEIERWSKTAHLKKGLGRTQTLQVYDKLISSMVEYGEKSLLVRDTAKGIIQLYSSAIGFSARDDIWVFASIQDWIQRNVNYIRDGGQRKEIFITPQRQLLDWARGTGGADCDDLSILYASLIKTIGKESAVVLLDANKTGSFNHAIGASRPEYEETFKGQWVPVELTIRKPYGWVIPHTKTYFVK